MANVAANDKKKAGPEFGNAKEVYRVQFDAAEDDLTTANDIELLEAEADLAIVGYYVKGITELDSAGDGVTIDIGVDGGAELMDGVAEASFAAGSLLQPLVTEGTPNVLALPLKLASGSKITMKKIGEALTSGKCEFFFEVVRF